MALPILGRLVAGRLARGAIANNSQPTNTFRLRKTTNNIERRIAKLNKALPKIVDAAYDKFVDETPYKTGNAKSKTRQVRNEIRADYPYANRLNEGYSRQSPEGMTEPTIKEIRNIVKKI